MRYLLTIKYDGTNYHGWQVQKNAQAIQPVIQNALSAILGGIPAVSGCSRTDSGVHVNMYCCHFDTPLLLEPKNIINAVNHSLPRDIAAYGCRRVPEDFHARYSCQSKQYVYKFLNAPYRDPFLDGYTYRIYSKMDENLLNDAAGQMAGRFDFTSFCAVKAKEGSKIRTVKSAFVAREGDIVTFSVEADGFLYNMARIMAGTLIRVHEKRIRPDGIRDIIRAKDRNKAGPTAPPYALYLNKVNY